MKTYRLLVLLICANGWATELSGEISGYLYVENSPYYVVADLTIVDSLVIEPGCVFFTNPNIKIHTDFDSYIKAEGTEMDSIIFTHNPNQPEVAWGGLNLLDAPENTSIFRYCKIENAAPINGGFNYGNGVQAGQTSLIIDHSIIQNNKIRFYNGGGSGIKANQCRIELSNSIIKNNSYIGNTLPQHGGGLWINEPEPGSFVKNCIFFNNGRTIFGGGIEISFAHNNLRFENNLVIRNFSQSVGGGIALWFYSHPVIKNSIILNNFILPSSNDEPEFNEHSQIFSYSEFIIESSIISEDNCLFFNQLEPEEYGCDHPDYNFMNVDPMFVDAENGNYNLLPQSPAINSGTGVTDPDGSPPDIGPIYFHLTKGDVNIDGQIDILDIISGVQCILLNSELWNSQQWTFDMNDDINHDVLDILQIVNVILGE